MGAKSPERQQGNEGDGGKEGKEGAEEVKPITAGYRPLWGQNGLLALFWTLITFPLGILGLFFLSPLFILVIILSIGLFVGGVTMIELEQRDPRVPDKEWQKKDPFFQKKDKKEDPKPEDPKTE